MTSNTTVIPRSDTSAKSLTVPPELLLAIFDNLSLSDLSAAILVCRNWSMQADRTILTHHPVPLEVALRQIDLLRLRCETPQSLPMTHVEVRNATLDVLSVHHLKDLEPSYGDLLFTNLRQLSIAVDRDVTPLLPFFPFSALESISFRCSGISGIQVAGILQHLAVCSKLQHLEFVHPLVPFPPSADAVTLPALRELSLDVKRNTETLLRVIEASKLQSIKLSQGLYSALDVGSLAYLAKRYPMLEHVTLKLDRRWSSSSLLNSAISLPHLRSLTLMLRHAVYWNLADEQYESISKKLSRLKIEEHTVDNGVRPTLASEALIKLSRHVPALQELSLSLDLRGSSSILEDLQPLPLLKTLRLTICSSPDPQDCRPSWSDVADWLVRACPKLAHFEVQLYGGWSDGEGECDPAAVFWEHHRRRWGVEMQGVSPPSSPGWRQL